MKNEEFATQKARGWQSKLHFHFDTECMPRIVPILGVTKNEIATKIMHSRNAERATKVMTGGSTDMKDMLALCARYDIDLAQLLLLPNGKHPVIITEEEYARLQAAANEKGEGKSEKSESADATPNSSLLTPNSSAAPVEVPEVAIDNQNAASLISNARESAQKIHSLYERIIELTAENARMKAVLGRYDLQTAMVKPVGMVQDGTGVLK